MTGRSFGRRGVGLILRVVATAMLVAAVFWLVDWRAALEAARGADPLWLAAALLCVIGARVTITIRWALLLAASGRRLPFRRLFAIVSAGFGLGALIPTSIGPDIARGWLLHAEATGRDGPGGGLETTVSSVMLDRYISTLGTLIVGVGGALALGQFWATAGLTAALAALLLIAVGLLVAAEPAIRRLTPGPLERLRPKLAALVAAFHTPGLLRRGAGPATLVAVGTALCRVAVFLCIYRALGWPVPVALACLAIPLTLIAMMIPVTLGGFGVRELMLVASFEGVGVPAAVSVTAGVLFFALLMLASLPATVSVLLPRRRGVDKAAS